MRVAGNNTDVVAVVVRMMHAVKLKGDNELTHDKKAEGKFTLHVFDPTLLQKY